jgi:hypothetical protein
VALEGEVEVLTEALTQTQNELDHARRQLADLVAHRIGGTVLHGVVEDALREAYRRGHQRSRGPVPSAWMEFVLADELAPDRARVRKKVRALAHQVLVDSFASMYERYRHMQATLGQGERDDND